MHHTFYGIATYGLSTTTILRPFSGTTRVEPVPEENFWTLWYKGRLTGADTSTIRLGATPSKLTSAHLHLPPIYGFNGLQKEDEHPNYTPVEVWHSLLYVID